MAESKCQSIGIWFYRTSFILVLLLLGGLSLVLHQVLSHPIVVTQKYKLGFNILFVSFALLMSGLTLSTLTDYAKHKKLCRCTIFSYMILTVVVLTVAVLEGKMLYDVRTSMKMDMTSKCDPVENKGLLGRLERYDNAARKHLCSPQCPCSLVIPYKKRTKMDAKTKKGDGRRLATGDGNGDSHLAHPRVRGMSGGLPDHPDGVGEAHPPSKIVRVA